MQTNYDTLETLREFWGIDPRPLFGNTMYLVELAPHVWAAFYQRVSDGQWSWRASAGIGVGAAGAESTLVDACRQAREGLSGTTSHRSSANLLSIPTHRAARPNDDRERALIR